MDKFTENLVGGIRRIAMVGVGAVAATVDKSREIIDHLAERGETAAAGSQAACDDLQKKMSAQIDAFSKKVRSDLENSSFESLLKKCGALTPEQKEALIAHLTAAPEATEEQPSETVGNETDNSVPVEGFQPTNVQENSESTNETEPDEFIDSAEEICPEESEDAEPPADDE